MVAILERRSLRDFDWMLALLAIIIVCFGAWEIHNAQPTEAYWQKQLIGLGIALVAMVAIAFTDYRRLVELAPVFYVFGLLLLLIVLVPGIGMKVNGQRCWIKLPGVGQFQPSEFVKIGVILALARYLSPVRKGDLPWRDVIIAGLIAVTPVGLIMLQPDAGTATTFFAILAVMLFMSGLNLKFIIVSVLSGPVEMTATGDPHKSSIRLM